MFKPKLVLKAAQELSSAKKSVKKNTKRLLFMTTSSTRQSASLKLLQHAQAGADISCWQAGEKLQANANWFCVVIHLSQLAPELISQYLAIASQWPVVIIANKNQARDFQQLENTAVDFEWLSENVLDIDYLNRAIDIAVLKYRLSHAADEQGYGDHRDEFAREGVLDRTQFFQQANTLLATSQSTQQAQYFQLVQCRWIKTKNSDLTWQDSELLSSNLAKDALTQLGAPFVLIQKVIELILATKCHTTKDKGDTALFLDVDLGILAAQADVYKTYADNCRKEYTIPNFVYNIGRKKFLRSLLKRDFIFNTALFQKTKEYQLDKRHLLFQKWLLLQ